MSLNGFIELTAQMAAAELMLLFRVVTIIYTVLRDIKREFLVELFSFPYLKQSKMIVLVNQAAKYY